MNGLPYYKAYPRDFIEGTIGMAFDLKCAYRVVLDLIYMQGGALPDDARYIAGLLGCSLRKWSTIRQGLIDLGKIQVAEGSITNYRAIIELETLSKLQDKQRENRSRPNKIKGLQSPRSDHTEPEPERRKEEAKASQKSGTRLSPDWFLPLEWGTWATAEGLTVEAVRLEADRFRDYFHSLPGQKGVKLDWQATWRNWVRKAKELQPRQSKSNGGRHDRREFDANWNRYVDGLADGSIDASPRVRDPFAAR